jgi:hypothetical protein
MSISPSGAVLKGRVLSNFPANVRATGGLSLTKENGEWVFSPDWASLPDDYPFIRWDDDQGLDEDAQEQARENIGVNRSDVSYVSTYEEATDRSFPAGLKAIVLLGYYEVGDLGRGAHYMRVASEPSTDGGKLRSLDRYLPSGDEDDTNGGWWKLVNTELNVGYFGAKGDGTTDDSDAMNACVAFADARGGGCMIIPKGWDFGVQSLVDLCSNLYITGGGKVTNIREGEIGLNSVARFVFMAFDKQNIVIDNIEIDGKTSVKTGDHGSGISFQKVDNFAIINCYIHDCTRRSITIGKDSEVGATTFGIVANNRCTGAITGVWAINDVHYLVIANNNCGNASGHAIYVDEGHQVGSDDSNVVINGNLCWNETPVVDESTRAGIGASGTHHITITGNTVWGYDRGVSLSAGQNDLYIGKAVVAGNTIRALRMGIRLSDVGDLLISGNHIALDSGSSSDGFAIWMNTVNTAPDPVTRNIHIIGNYLESFYRGIYSAGDSTAEDEIFVLSNVVKYVSAAGVSADAGIDLQRGDTQIVAFNMVLGAFTRGIRIDADCTNAVVQGNLITGATSQAIANQCATATYVGNTTWGSAVGFTNLTGGDASTLILKDNNFLDSTPTSGTISSAYAWNNYGLNDNIPAVNHGTQSSGTLTIVTTRAPEQRVVNGGAFALACNTARIGSTILTITNNSSAGAIDTSNFDYVTGDPFDNTNASRFKCFIEYDGTSKWLHMVKVA